MSGVYTESEAVDGTFRCIQTERNIRRQCGKILCKLLSQLAAGKHYEAALKSANALGTEVQHVAAARHRVCAVLAVDGDRAGPPSAAPRQSRRARHA